MSNEIKTRSLTPTEQKYTYAQSMQLEGQTGTIGHGKLLSLASEIGAEETMLADISHLFSVAYSSLWNSEMGEAEIRKLIVDYTFVKETNTLLNCNAHSKAEAFEKWREKLEFAMCSHEALEEKFASLKEVYSFLFDIVTRKDILPDQMEKCTQSLCEQRLDVQHYFDNEVGVFYEIYKAYLDDISVEEATQLKVPQLINVFRKSKTESRAANVEVHGGASLEEVVVPVIELTLADSSMQVALSDKNIVSDYKDGASILLYVNKSIKQVISLVVEGERYFGEKVDENHYRINVANMKRAKTYSADVYVGESLITRIDVTTKGKSASVNSDFDDLF